VDELAELVEAVRAAVASRLPAADPDRRLVTLDPGTEDRLARWIHVRNGKRFLALPADEAEELYAGLRDRFDQELIASLAVVVRSRGLRPYARRLIKSVEPGLAVVALGEVPEERRLIRS
jgi:flagellar biosynthesis component FlhA